MKTCRQCEIELSDSKSEIGYGWNNHDVCKKCYDEISAEVNKGWKYEDFWQVEQKYPRIFKQGMYKNKTENKNLFQRLFAK